MGSSEEKKIMNAESVRRETKPNKPSGLRFNMQQKGEKV